MEPADESRLDRCLTSMVEKVEEALKELQKKRQPSTEPHASNGSCPPSDPLLDNSVQSNNVNTFTVDRDESDLLDTLTNDIQNSLRDALPQLSTLCTTYIGQHLQQYHFDAEQSVFTEGLTASILYSLKHDLNGLRLAARAYPAALRGDVKTVEQFLKSYPDYKDRPGFWGTTLLYSAAKSDQLPLVRFLVETIGCSVNAQNLSEMSFVLINDNDTARAQTTALPYNPDPRFASTPLHAACYNNNLEIVKYLIEKRANCYSRNQLGETPIQNGRGHQEIQAFFREYLVSAYLSPSHAALATEPILERHYRKPEDCIWEYKPVIGSTWDEFTFSENHDLSTALMQDTTKAPFNPTTYLNARQGTYNVNLFIFLRGGKNQEPNPKSQDSSAWIRCRGSSIANFDLHCVWQLMFLKYSTAQKQSSTEPPSLDAKTFPAVYDSKFRIKLNSWYTCDSRRNAILDDAMNLRRRYINIDCNFDVNQHGNQDVKCNLFTFTFANDDKTTIGFIRWIPKLIANTTNDQTTVKVLDNFKMINNFNPTPLSTKRLEEMTGLKSASASSLSIVEQDEQKMAELTSAISVVGHLIDNGGDDEDEKQLTSASAHKLGTWDLNDLLNDDFQPVDDEDEPAPAAELPFPNLSDFIDRQAKDPKIQREKVVGRSVEEADISSRQNETAKKAQAALEENNKQLAAKVILLQNQLDEQLNSSRETTDMARATLNSTMDELENLRAEIKGKTEQENLIKTTVRQITTLEYTIPRLNHLINPSLSSILGVLRRAGYSFKEYFQDTVPSIELNDEKTRKITLRGFPIHHQEMKNIFERLEQLVQQMQSSEDYYRQQNNRRIQSLLATIRRVKPTDSTHWKPYSSSLNKLIQEKSNEYIRRFGVHLSDHSKALVDSCIEHSTYNLKTKITELNNGYMQAETFSTDMQLLKNVAFDEFITEHIFSQQKSTKTIPTMESVSSLHQHIENMKRMLKTKTEHRGVELKHFQLIVSLLQRVMIFYHCFLAQLPLFNASIDLLDKIATNTVTTIETATGSGKSTLLPALLAADGYDKIIVTQPRRLPCTLISQRVNSMVNDTISGWAVSGAESNVKAQVLYLTDGLLRERLLNDENFITTQSNVIKSVVFFIDEVHERSINIDLCLGLFARLLKLNPPLKTKMKLVISSATLDASVPTIFRNISDCSMARINLASLSTLYPVTVHRVPQENLLDLVQKLYAQRNRHDQILCFVSSTQETHENCAFLKSITKGAVIAYPLIQSQSAIDQQKNIEQGSVFFSTTVAETSLTFPCLKYVIDTGLINMPVYSIELERTELQEIKTAESTTKQRLGRLGRTQPGEYYALYDYPAETQRKYPVPQICQSDLATTEFALRKSRSKTSLKAFQEFLPDRPKCEYIDDAIQQLRNLGLIDTSTNERFTKLGAAVAQLPDCGSLPMAKAVYAALKTYRCGRDLIVLSSILSVLNTSTILKSIPLEYKRPEGDFMTLLQVMNTILLVRDAVPPKEFNLDRVCTAKRLSAVAHTIKPAIRRYKNLERAFNLSGEFRELSKVQSGNWENIAKALLRGFSDKVYVSQKILQGKTQQYIRYNVQQRGEDSFSKASSIAVIDRSSTLRTGNKGAVPASVVLARDVRYLTAVRSSAILSFVGQVEPSWLEYTFTRRLKLTEAEANKLIDQNILQQARQQFQHLQVQIDQGALVFQGPSGHIFNTELFVRQQLRSTHTFSLVSDQPANVNNNLTRNLKSVTSMSGDLFGPLRWRWESEQQVKVRTKMNKNQGTIDVTVEGLDSQNQAVEKEFKSFLSWLRMCAVIRQPDSGVSPRALKSQIREQFRDMELRISNITDPDRTPTDIWKSLKGPTASRVSRMEVVAWIAVCQFHCRLEGGFVRDWVVGGFSSSPKNVLQSQWLQKQPSSIPMLHKDLVPSDLDCHLPQSKNFDVETFQDALYNYGFTATPWRQDWRYVILIDEDAQTGPFTMDLIEPHIALTHDRIDFDVSNLSLERGYTKDLGMRVDITGGTDPIQLETIVENIRRKHFQVLRPVDGENGPNTSGTVAERIEKMKSRGWTQVGAPLSFIPNPPSHYDAVLVPYPPTTLLYQNLVTEMNKINGVHVISIEQIKNPNIEALYEYMKRTIAKECPGNDPHERELFHGTKVAAIQGIIARGFDDRYFSPTGAWGRGAYFADDPRKSNNYAESDPTTSRRVMFYNKVVLGVESVQTATDHTLGAAPLNHHSVHGTGFQYHEYIVYRYGQALPYLKITYTAPS